MGFERMIHFPIVELPSALAYHAIDHFHPGSMELRLEKGSIKATRQKVHDMLGIPMGRRKLKDLEERPSNDPFIKDTMGTLDNGGRVSTKLLKRITEDVDISYIDWCRYILDCLQTSKKNWKDVKTRNNFYYGPVTFLCFDPEEEQDGMNVYKGLDVYVPPINDKEPETKEIRAARVSLMEMMKTTIMMMMEHQQQMQTSKKKVTIKRKNKTKKRLINKQKKEESGSEATEGGSDGKDENMDGDEREVTAQMDVDNQNKELNKEKDANETEDNDKMNNNKIDNVEENQGDHKDETGEDEFWNTQFTNSQCEELENQAKEENSKEKVN
ncbi:hypothetical protein Tco_1191136 [Tanacetum coccineum]